MNATLAAVLRIIIIATVKGDVRTVLERTATTATEGNSVQDGRCVTWSTKLLVSWVNYFFTQIGKGSIALRETLYVTLCGAFVTSA